jgi:hypothetical protein
MTGGSGHDTAAWVAYPLIAGDLVAFKGVALPLEGYTTSGLTSRLCRQCRGAAQFPA